MERIDRKREEVNIEEVAEFLKKNLYKEIFCFIIKKVLSMYSNYAAYVMITGIMNFIDDFIEAGIDLLYFFDPVLDKININELKEKVKNKFCIAGGINSTLTLKNGDEKEIEKQIRDVIEIYGKKGIILSPVDSLFPDTPYENVKKMIEIYKNIAERDDE